MEPRASHDVTSASACIAANASASPGRHRRSVRLSVAISSEALIRCPDYFVDRTAAKKRCARDHLAAHHRRHDA
ncbi:hypothetical protein ACEPUD_01870 [Burkholderia ubonensis]